MLLEEGADPNIADTTGMAALYAAVDMSSLGEVYGRPARKVTDRLDGARHRRAAARKGGEVNAKLKPPALQRNHTPGEPLLATARRR